MTSDQFFLLDLLKESLFGIRLKSLPEVDWHLVLKEAQDQAVAGLAAPTVQRLAEIQKTEDASSALLLETERWTKISNQYYAYFILLLIAQRELVNIFKKRNIPIVILKGTAAAIYYKNPERRAMGDVDFLVPQDRFEDAKELMELSGYQVQYGEEGADTRHIGYKKDNISFEMHHHFSSFDLDIEPALLQGMKQAETGTILGESFPMLPPLENGLVLLAHIRQHLLEEAYSLGLRQIIDWMMYVNCYCGSVIAGKATWDDAFFALAQKYRLDTLAITVTYICKRWLGLPSTPVWCNQADGQTAEELFEVIMASGNFGRKHEESNLTIKQGIISYRREGIFKRLQNSGLRNWKAAQKYRFLKPIAWIYQGFRVLVLGIKAIFTSKTGFKQISEGNKKSELLKRLKI